MPPGIVPNAVSRQSMRISLALYFLRPVNSANVTNVPNSDSKRSRRGAKATRLKIMWKKLRCITGNRLSRCTADKNVSVWCHKCKCTEDPITIA
jgi:hypothetical protein